jgi:putative PIN family toxin of toxin-antitoxin system
MLNAVADSTVLVSAFLRKEGVSAVLLRHAAGGVFALSLSQAIVTETETVLLEREHIRRRYPYSDEDVAEFCQTLQDSFPLLTDLPPLTSIVRDPNDDMVLATARAADATYLITRDLDLLSLQSYEGIIIITPEAFMAMLREHGRTNP